MALALGGAWARDQPAAADGAAGLADPCAAIDSRFVDKNGETPFRPLPVLSPATTPGGRVLSLGLRAQRADSVMIGGLRVHGAPVFVITPQAGSRASLTDPRTGEVTPMPAACLSSPAWAYAGTRWALAQGDRLKVRLISALDFRKGELRPPVAGGVSCRAANLHTHGLMVSPYKAMGANGRTLYGDYVLDAATPAGDAGADDPCGSPAASAAMAAAGAGMAHALVSDGMDYDTHIPGVAGQSDHRPGGHPSGPFWFHPHTHGYTGLLTTGGATGVITIGAVSDYACARGAGDVCEQPSPPVRDLLLKDAQLAPDHGDWRLEYDRDYDLEGACVGGRAESHRGQCADWRDHRWLFTVNGVRYPVISDVQAGRPEIWRIVNASANVTYRLRLRPVGAPDGAALPLQVLSLEGAGADPRGWAEPGASTEILLMPAARAEIAIAAPPAGGAYVLEQQPFWTGGDVWPAIALAEVRFPPRADAGGPGLMLHASVSETRAPDHFYAGAPDGCGFANDDVRHIYFVKRPTYTEERVRLDTFGLLAAVAKGGGPPMLAGPDGAAIELTAQRWRALLASDPPHAPAYMHNPFGTVCTFLGHAETWVLENDTDEAHNFHIHQSEFQLALDKRGDPGFFSAAPPADHSKLVTASDRAVAAADGAGRESDEAALYHDTIPVPRGISLGGRGCDGAPMNTRTAGPAG